MTAPRIRRPVPAIMLKPDEAAAAMGVSRNYFDANILPFVPHVRRGGKIILVPVRELEKWAEANAGRPRRGPQVASTGRRRSGGWAWWRHP